jgi:hypothetical protein
MKTRFFCFPDMATSFQMAAAAGMTTHDENGEPRFIAYSHDWAAHVQGEIDGLPGWHVYVRTSKDIPAELLPFEWFPTEPMPGDFA